MDEKKLINDWLSAFGKDVDKKLIKKHVISSGNLLWHLFTWGKVSCLEGDEARNAFDNLNYSEAIKFCDGYSGHIEGISLTEKVSAAYLDNSPESDVYITAKDFSWTYVRTHEKDFCGPYFCRIIN